MESPIRTRGVESGHRPLKVQEEGRVIGRDLDPAQDLAPDQNRRRQGPGPVRDRDRDRDRDRSRDRSRGRSRGRSRDLVQDRHAQSPFQGRVPGQSRGLYLALHHALALDHVRDLVPGGRVRVLFRLLNLTHHRIRQKNHYLSCV